MKKVVIGIIAVGTLVSMQWAGAFAATKTVTGEIMDSQCALQGGKHDNMIRVGQDEKACTEMCIKLGGSYVLYDEKTKTTYKLADQAKAKPFAGAKVSITGDLNDATKTIKITTIKKG
jgi:hypothetical protein